MTVLVPISWGELLDKLSILEIKVERLPEAAQIVNARKELDVLTAVRDAAGTPNAELAALYNRLKAINERIWEVEDEVRRCEHRRDFGEAFVALARQVYINNDERARIKREINQVTASELVEEKSYADYTRAL
jgi:N12 class adenine-specific DNA methylase